ncbi:uncharacterized protein FOMMEDRAFT_27196 [Fomitiporia mediterranea MF3/22]|uniref:uncharacterized protein n=1 Tax=Fomitiporia mediterranea (strain MF3/22) TaxID=694068 RepID=UPI0004408480|nr:uncharacterized protein FOMMEDRAFT_27196 [Fomitiporia mediterranea MF3/22]EJD04908.1 hypothetical protein FOMMEDRAFT_27196 [Fomitiporia mediterranea MF3/22]
MPHHKKEKKKEKLAIVKRVSAQTGLSTYTTEPLHEPDLTIIGSTEQGFLLLERIGQGHFGTVFKCQKENWSEVVAVKALKGDGTSKTQQKQLNEWETMRKIGRHENIDLELLFSLTTYEAAKECVSQAKSIIRPQNVLLMSVSTLGLRIADFRVTY